MTETDSMCREKKEGRGVASIEYREDASLQRLEDHTKKNNGTFITVPKNRTNDISTNTITKTNKQK